MIRALALIVLLAGSACAQGLAPTPGGLRGGGGGASPNLFTGITNGTLRNDFDGSVGGEFKTGTGTPTITQLCRWKVSGNSQTHTVYLLNNPGLSGWVVVTSVTVDMSTGSAGSWVCTALGSPHTVVASTFYVVMSSETNGGDQWYTDDSTIGGIYSGFTGEGSVFASPTPPPGSGINNHSPDPAIYVPVNAVLTP